MSTAQHEKVSDYNKVFKEKDYDKRSKAAQKVTDNFYTLITKFYERGWGQSFHFAPRQKGEDFQASILRHEHHLSDQLKLGPKDKVLDVGCGIMGPARNIAKYSGANITGLTINQHQVNRCKELNAASEAKDLLQVQQGDFMDIPFPDNSFDKMYAIEALCHAPSILGVYQQISQKLKPAGTACFYQWALTDKYDPSNAEHVKAKEMIEYGNGITRLSTIQEINQAIDDAGFEKELSIDLAKHDAENNMPWYATLQSGWSLSQIKHTKVSRTFTHYLLRTLEAFGIAKKGVSRAQKILLVAADGLVAGGKLDIFTPMHMFVVRKKAN
ncbi:MAG: class I SAM-dependent methyltransferase [Chitinophagales bacterium]